MNPILAVEAFRRDAIETAPETLTPPAAAAIAACLEKRRDAAPLSRENWPIVLAESELEWTGFAMTIDNLTLCVATTRGPREKLSWRAKRVYWVLGGPCNGELPDQPLSCHGSLALAAEMLMMFYGALCQNAAGS